MTDKITIAAATPLGDTPPEWVKLFPVGKFSGRDGRGPYKIDNPAALVAATRAYHGNVDMPIDYDHQTIHSAANGQPIIAAGWIKELKAETDGIYGKIEWTETAAARIKAKEYRYISPGFQQGHGGQVVRIMNAGLTNAPNLDIPAIASQQGDQSMESVLKEKLTTALGLPPDMSDDALIAHCQRQSLTAASAFDATKFVPMSQFEQIAAQLKEVQGHQALASVDVAIQSGKITPASRDWAVEYANKDPQGFAKFLDKAPVIAAAQTVPAAQLPASGMSTLSPTELTVCAQMGLSPEQYLKAKGDK